MCLATSANDETWTSSKQSSVLEAPLLGAAVVAGGSVVVTGSSLGTTADAVRFFETSVLISACCA